MWRDAGRNRITASGRPAGRASTSPSPRSWHGSSSIAPSRRWNVMDCAARSTSGGSCGHVSMPRCATVASIRCATPSGRPLARRRSTPACCCSPRSASSRRAIHDMSGLSRRSNGTCSSTASYAATTRKSPMTGSNPVKASSWPAASGSRTPTSPSDAARRPRVCSTACWRCATISGCSRRNTIREIAGRSATSRKPSPTSR